MLSDRNAREPLEYSTAIGLFLPALTPHSKRSEPELPKMQACFRRSELELRDPGTTSKLIPEAPE
eukprot:13461346-Alexandrium_andersonii.AAC.1